MHFHIIFTLLFLLPVILVVGFAINEFPNLGVKFEKEVLIEAVLNSAIQGVVTATVGALLGLVWFFCIRSYHRYADRVAILFLVPFLMPALYLLSVYYAFGLSRYMNNFSVGIVQGYVISGYFAFKLWKSYQHKWIRLEEISLIFAAGRLSHWLNSLRLLSQEFLELFLISMLLGLTSFSIPLAIGGINGANFEVLIFERLRLGTSSSELITMCILQFSLFFLIELLKPQINFNPSEMSDSPRSHFNADNRLLFPNLKLAVVAYCFVFLVPLIGLFSGGLKALIEMSIDPVLYNALINSLLILLMVIIAINLYLLLFSYAYYLDPKRAMGSYLFPFSASALAVVFWNLSWVPSMVALIIVYGMTMSPFLIKFGLITKLTSLEYQLLISGLYGKSVNQAWLKIVYPQIRGQVLFLSSIGGAWALMDFAVIKLFISEAHYTLAGIAQGWLASYRYFEAQGLIFILFLLSIFFVGGVHLAFNQNK